MLKVAVVDDSNYIKNQFVKCIPDGVEMDIIAETDSLLLLERIKKLERLDLLITDYLMPNLDGIELAKEVVAVHPAAKLIFISAEKNPLSATDPICGSILFWALKPVNIPKIKKVLGTVLAILPE